MKGKSAMNVESAFQELRIVDNFYQTSSFYPMPIVIIGTQSEGGQTNLGPYSLCFPYYIAGKGYYAMALLARNSSNTARNILRTGKASINFIPDKRRYMKQAVALGYPGDSTEEKMKNCIFTLEAGLSQKEHPDLSLPHIVKEAFQVFECTWMRELDGASSDTVQETYPGPYHDFNGITCEFGAHFILRIDHILMKPLYRSAIVNGVKSRLFPRMPVDYGYRDNTSFWISRFIRPYSEKIPKGKGTEVSTVYYAANRVDPRVTFTEDACAKLVSVPRVFLKPALQACVDWAVENGIQTITDSDMDIIRDKRAKEK
ncbi:hypothetical protein MASR2M48_18740 [Spirochaetota bacterium]